MSMSMASGGYTTSTVMLALLITGCLVNSDLFEQELKRIRALEEDSGSASHDDDTAASPEDCNGVGGDGVTEARFGWVLSYHHDGTPMIEVRDDTNQTILMAEGTAGVEPGVATYAPASASAWWIHQDGRLMSQVEDGDATQHATLGSARYVDIVASPDAVWVLSSDALWRCPRDGGELHQAELIPTDARNLLLAASNHVWVHDDDQLIEVGGNGDTMDTAFTVPADVVDVFWGDAGDDDVWSCDDQGRFFEALGGGAEATAAIDLEGLIACHYDSWGGQFAAASPEEVVATDRTSGEETGREELGLSADHLSWWAN